LGTAALTGGALLAAVGTTTVGVVLENGQAAGLGRAIFTGWVLPFELLSVLLLAALVGAIALARAIRAFWTAGAGTEPDPAPVAAVEGEQ
jgi:NADH-quinone oxidoreductase subunit J